MSAEQPSRVWRVLDVALVVFVSAQTLAGAYVTAARVGFRELQPQLLDYAWQLELAWLAGRGELSGFSFQYPRGPLWQLLALPAGLLDPFEAGPALALLELTFRAASIVLVVWLAVRFTRPGARRTGLLFVLLAVSHGAGIATLRGLLSALFVVLATDAVLSETRARRSAIAAATVLTLASLVSIDRAALGVLSLIAIGVCAVAFQRPRRPVLRRVGELFLACVLVALLVALIGALVGAAPDAYLLAQRRFAVAYGANLATMWRDVVPTSNIAALGLLATAVALSAARRGGPVPCWIAGALPTTLFGLLQSDVGHIYLAVLPLVVALTLAALTLPPPAFRASGSERGFAGLLMAIFLLGWFGLYPKALALSPHTFVDLYRHSQDPPRETEFETDLAQALRWTREHAANDACVGVRPGLTLVHALADQSGPTVLGIRWSPTQQAELATAIREADCPRFVYLSHSYDFRESTWAFGDDFLEVATRYEAVERVGPAVWGMRRREQPLEPSIETLVDAPHEAVLGPGSTLVVELGERVPSEHLLELEYTYDVERWRTAVGGTPRLVYRFLHEGEPVHDWLLGHHLTVGRRSAFTVAVDGNAAEHRWIAGESTRTPKVADAIELRAVSLGILSDPAPHLTVHAIHARAPPGDGDRDESPERCEDYRELASVLHAGGGLVRYVRPRHTEHMFFVTPTVSPEPAAEIFLPIRPCELSCFRTEVGVEANPDGDGARITFDAIDEGSRPRLGELHVPSGAEVPIELPLGGFAGQELLLRIQSHGGDDPNDEPYLILPVVGQCSARTRLSYVLQRGYAVVEDGVPRLDGRDVNVDGSARVAYELQNIENTCLRVDWQGEAPAEVSVAVRTEGVEHVVEQASGLEGSLVASLGDFTWRRIAVALIVEGSTRLIDPRLEACE